jgi:endonuclease YncB( thermonuclease family)
MPRNHRPTPTTSRLTGPRTNGARIVGLVSAFAILCAGLVLLAPSAHAVDYDCSDFRTQAAAQKYLLPGDPHRLDADGDGRACDSLPCPCSGTKPKSSPTTGATIRQWARVVRVVDGDTVKVRLTASGARRDVRLLGIDTPEVHGRKECYGAAASRLAKRMLPPGTRVRLVSDPTQARVDRYGRLLRYVSKGKVDVDRCLVYRGAARVYVHNRKAFKRLAGYRSAQASAKAHKRGLWRACR